VTKKVYAGAAVSQSNEFFNVSVNAYTLPTNYTTYACNVSTGPSRILCSPLVVAAEYPTVYTAD